jgi:hypothetical protein
VRWLASRPTPVNFGGSGNPPSIPLSYGQWRIRCNEEFYELYGEPDLVTCIKLKRLQWTGHIQRMEGTRIPKEVYKAKFEGVRLVGKPRKRWEDMVQQDAARFL